MRTAFLTVVRTGSNSASSDTRGVLFVALEENTQVYIDSRFQKHILQGVPLEN